MNLIDIYISEVGKDLPRKNREDIETEIRSALEDMLEERSRETGKAVDDEMIFEVLKEYGAPEKVAASYHPERYLIGPKLFPGYLTVIRIVLPIIVVFALIGAGTALAEINPTGDVATAIANAIGEAIAGFFSAALSALGSITLIFAILQWTIPNLQQKERVWDAHSLLKVYPPDRIKIGDAIMEIVGAAAGLVIFNFYPQIVGVSYSNLSGWTHVQVLSDAFFTYLPALNILWLLIIMFNIFLLRRGSWNSTMRWLSLGVQALTIGMAAALFAGPALIAVSAEALTQGGMSLTNAEQLVELLNQLVRVVLVMTIVFGGWKAIKILFRLLGRETPPTFISHNSPSEKNQGRRK
jgi:hypothetical protein